MDNYHENCIKLLEIAETFVLETRNYSYYDFRAYLMDVDAELSDLMRNKYARNLVAEFLKGEKRKNKAGYSRPQHEAMKAFSEKVAEKETTKQ